MLIFKWLHSSIFMRLSLRTCSKWEEICIKRFQMQEGLYFLFPFLIMTTYQTFSPPKQLIFQKITALKLFTDSYPMPLIEANFIYTMSLLLGTLGYVCTLQRPIIYIWSDQVVIRTCTQISFTPSKMDFDIKGTQFTYNMAYAHYWQNKPFIKPPDSKRLTRRNIEFTDMLILICYWWLYLNLISPILQAVGAI